MSFAAGGGTPASVVTSKTLPGGIEIVGPSGYCPDPDTQRGGQNQAAVALASCVRVSGSDEADTTQGRLLSAASLGAGQSNLTEIKQFFSAPEGRSALASQGNPEDVKIHEVTESKVAVYVEYTDANRIDHLGARAWRAFLNVKDTTLLLSVYAGAGDSVAGDVGESLIRDFAAAILDKNS